MSTLLCTGEAALKEEGQNKEQGHHDKGAHRLDTDKFGRIGRLHRSVDGDGIE